MSALPVTMRDLTVFLRAITRHRCVKPRETAASTKDIAHDRR